MIFFRYIKRGSESREAQNKWFLLSRPSLGAGMGQALTAVLLIGLGIMKTRKDFFPSIKYHHIHLSVQALRRKKKENLQEAFLVTAPLITFLSCVPRGLKVCWLVEHAIRQSLYWAVPHDAFLRTQAMASAWTPGHQGAGLMETISCHPSLNGIGRI